MHLLPDEAAFKTPMTSTIMAPVALPAELGTKAHPNVMESYTLTFLGLNRYAVFLSSER